MFQGIIKRHLPIILLIFLNLVVCFFVLPDFGESVDESSQQAYAQRTIDAAKSMLTQGVIPAEFSGEKPQQGSHGPAFIMTVTLLKNWLMKDGDTLSVVYFYHFFYFMAFLAGVVAMYALALRWVSAWAAMGAALLLNTQPMLFGHAFINPKDTVFMAFMIVSLVLGLWMIDQEKEDQRALPGQPFNAMWGAFLRPEVWLAGMLLGFTSAIRLVAPLVGFMLMAYLLIQKKWRTLPSLMAYGIIAFGFMILFWPYLWPDPISRLLESVLHSANYPGEHKTIFQGVVYASSDIPASYIPTLLALQLTEPTLLIAVFGLFHILKKMRPDLLALVLIWFFIPVGIAVLAQINLYNNLRQIFFIFPPVFLLAGIGFDALFGMLKKPILNHALIVAILLPALYANIMLHPYQYIYYNQFAGGVRGAYRQYDLDYWNLAYKEAQEFINQNANREANIFCSTSSRLARIFARKDLKFNKINESELGRYDFLITTTSRNYDEPFASFETAYAVMRDGVPLALVKAP